MGGERVGLPLDRRFPGVSRSANHRRLGWRPEERLLADIGEEEMAVQLPVADLVADGEAVATFLRWKLGRVEGGVDPHPTLGCPYRAEGILPQAGLRKVFEAEAEFQVALQDLLHGHGRTQNH